MIPMCETLSRVQVSHGPEDNGGCWKGFTMADSVKCAPAREETKKGKKIQVGEEEGSKREDISGPPEGM